MSVEFIKINGESEFIDYSLLEDSFKHHFKNCSSVCVYVINKFPILISSKTDIDLIIIVVVENKKGNYIQFHKNGEKNYLHNLIIPVRYITDFKKSNIETLGDNLLIDGGEVDYSIELKVMYELKNYLKNRCQFDEIYIHPIVFVENEKCIINGDVLVAPQLSFDTIFHWLNRRKSEYMTAYKEWKYNYLQVDKDIQKIVHQASQDSELGFLTKLKIEKILQNTVNTNSLKNEIGKSTILIKGKAGSGKTTELLSLCVNSLEKDYNSYFLTYNNVLVYDIAQLLKSIRNQKQINKYTTVRTLHSFFFDLSKSLSVLGVMSENRIKEILDVLKNRIRSCYDIIQKQISFDKQPDYDNIKTLLQNLKLDIGTIEIGIDFVNFLSKKQITSEEKLNQYAKQFFESREEKLIQLKESDIFLSDYYNVLKKTLFAIQNSNIFYQDFDIKNKKEIISRLAPNTDTYFNDKGEIEEKKFNEFINRRIGGRKGKNRIIFIDEGQDCHRLEKEILSEIYGVQNFVVASGGKEQLIRYPELCNWNRINGKSIVTSEKNKTNKSYRIKAQIADFCGFFSNKYNIDLKLESLNSTDKGEIIFDFRKSLKVDNYNELFDELSKKGTINGCKPYESILVLLNSMQRGAITDSEFSSRETIEINENQNIKITTEHIRNIEWSQLSSLKEHGFEFFDATIQNKSKMGIPLPNQIRVIYYESCRGLEGWSVTCFDLDKFFDAKYQEDKAEKFLIEEEKNENTQNMFISNETRKKMYAATWVLMALTRVIDTLYISVSDENSEIGQLINDYIKTNPKNIRVFR